MRYFLENDRLKVEIDSFGAEVKSLMTFLTAAPI